MENQVGRNNLVEFVGGIRANGFSDYYYGQWRKTTQNLINRGFSIEDAQRIAADTLDSDRGRKEVMAKYAEQRRHMPTERERAQHEANEEKKLIPEGSKRALKSYVETALKSLDNRIRSLRRAIEIGEKIPRKERRVIDDVRLIQKRQELEDAQKAYDELFKTSRTMTPEQRIAAAERATMKVMEGLAKEIADAENGMFRQ